MQELIVTTQLKMVWVVWFGHLKSSPTECDLDRVDFEAQQDVDLTGNDMICGAGGESRHDDVRQIFGDKAYVQNSKGDLRNSKSTLTLAN